MGDRATTTGWSRHIFYRTECRRTTWKFKIGLLLVIIATLWLTSPWWTAAIARSLICEPSLAPSDAILIENFDPDYLLFERARQLRRQGLATRVLVPVHTDRGTDVPNDVALGFVEVMAKVSRIGAVEIVPTREIEPITLNEALDVRRFLEREQIRSVVVVTPSFRSRRSEIVYGATLSRAGITVRYQPVSGSRGIHNWTNSWHGIQDVAEQWIKLQYYRFYVLPFVTPRPASGART